MKTRENRLLWMTQKNGTSDYSYSMEHCTALGPNILLSVIKFDHLANNKVIIITDQEIWRQNLKNETVVMVLGMSGTNIDHVVF